jgi:adenylosuccinate lyase
MYRDRHAIVMNIITLLGCGLENMAKEIRHLQRTEVQELFEPTGGKSVMLHKRNPVKSERICGMARLLRGYAVTSMENVALWHERDVSHSSAERVIWPDAFHTIHFMLADMRTVIQGIAVNEERVARNLELTGGLIYSQRVMLELIDELKLPRDTAYKVVHENATRTGQGDEKFIDLVKQDERLAGKVDEKKLNSLFDVKFFTRYVDTIFERFGL